MSRSGKGRSEGRKTAGRKTAATQDAWIRWLREDAPPPGPLEAASYAAKRFLAAREEPPPELPEPLALAVTAILGEDDDTATLGRLAQSGPRELTKAARRALHELKRKGLAVPETAPVDPAPRRASETLAEADAEDRRATMTAPFGEGERVAVFRFRGPGDRRLHAGVATWSDRLGLVDLQLFLGSARLYQEMVRGAAERLPVAEIPFAIVARRLARAADVSRSAGRLLPEHYGAFRSLVRPESLPLVAHPAEGLTAGPPPDAQATYALFEEPELRSWLPDKAALASLGKRFDEIGQSPVVLSGAQRQERFTDAFEEVLRSLWTEAERDALGLRLLDAAHVAAAHRRQEIAARLLGAREALLAAPEPHRIPLCRQLLLRPILGKLPPEVLEGVAPGLVPAEGGAPPVTESGLLWTGRAPAAGAASDGSLIAPGHPQGARR